MRLEDVKAEVSAFIRHARASDDTFFVTRVGCGLAGFEDADIAPLFLDGAPIPNTVWPRAWRAFFPGGPFHDDDYVTWLAHQKKIPMSTTAYIKAASFAAQRHRDQRRKGDGRPYVEHPLRVAEVLADAGVTDPVALIAAALHDTVEDTPTTIAEIEALFGAAVAAAVDEVTDDKDLPKAERKREQIRRAPGKTEAAALVKKADKLDNLRGFLGDERPDWPEARVRGYVVWAYTVVTGLREGTNAALDEQLAATFEELGIPRGTPVAALDGELRAYLASLK